MSFSFKDHRKKVEEKVERATETALTAAGIKIVEYAVRNITKLEAVDTGLLRNSITYALSGKAPAISSYSGDGAGAHSGRQPESGTYSGTADKDGDEQAVYVGTNVEYAPYVEYGTGKGSNAGGKPGVGGQQTLSGGRPRPFLKPALANHQGQIKKILNAEYNKAMK